MDLVDQAWELFKDGLQLAYDWTIGLIARALAQGPEGLPTLKLVIWAVLLGFVIFLVIQLIRALWLYFSKIWYLGFVLAVMVVLAALMVFVEDSQFALPS
jgi:hypothetical protein